MFLLESPRWGDSNENTQHTFILREIEKIYLLCFLTWRYEQHSLARTSPISNIFSWFQRCSSHWSSTVVGITTCRSIRTCNYFFVEPDYQRSSQRKKSCMFHLSPRIWNNSRSAQQGMIFFLLINVKMSTINGISTFLSKKNSILGLTEPSENRISWYFYTC